MEGMTKGNDERTARHKQRIVEALDEMAQDSGEQQNSRGAEQQTGKRGRTEDSGVNDLGPSVQEHHAGDKGATSSRDPEGSARGRKRTGGTREDEERPDKMRKK